MRLLWKCGIGLVLAFAVSFSLAMGFLNLTPALMAQTAVTGGLNGVVTDSAGAVVPGATVTVVETNTGDTRVLTTNGQGRYTAPFLKPGSYTVSASAKGLQSNAISVQILVGQQSVSNPTVTPTGSTQTVTVNSNNAQLIDTQTANLTTTFTTAQFENLPNPGGDITTFAFTVPGVVVNTNGAHGSYNGSFSSNGLPGISNLIILNGADQTDSFFNDSTAGASTLSIGASEVAQASLVQNGYSTEWGRQAGGVETYVTKGGANRVHGLLNYTYNSDGLNANDFFNNLNGIPRQKAVSHQYAAQIGGPVIHNRLFFFADTEGIRYVQPSTNYVNFPTAAFQNTVLNTIPAASVPLYTQMFNLLKTSPFYNTATPVTTGPGPLQDQSGTLGCGSYAGTPVFGSPTGVFGVDTPCMTAAAGVTSGALTEHMIIGRADWNINDKQKFFVRISDDQGFQPNFISVVNPLLNVVSNQPVWNGQLNHTYIFGPNVTNQFVASAFYYSFPFGPANLQQTLAASPAQFNNGSDGGTNFSTGLGEDSRVGFDWGSHPTSTNSTQYQFVDDISWLKGNHNLKFGANFKRYDVTDGYLTVNTYGGYYTFNTLGDLAGGVLPGSTGSNFNQTFNNVPSVHLSGYNHGIYAQDEWRATPRLVLDYGVRVDRNGNPFCTTNCFSRYLGNFPDPTATLDTPYNATIANGYSNSFDSLELAVIQPRFGFNWDTTGEGKSVLRGGVGLFADTFPAALIENQYLTFPESYGAFAEAGNVALGPGSAPAFAQASYNAITSGFSQGLSANQLAASLPAGVPFFAPNHYLTPHHMVNAKYLEWSLQFQQQLTPSDAVILSYVGNHGYDLISYDYGINQSLAGSVNSNGNVMVGPSLYTSFDGVPVNPPDPRFGQMGIINDSAHAGYNGISFIYKHVDRRGLTANVSYTYSHAIDDISNAGQGEVFNNNGFGNQIVPNHPSQLMYSNADYDIRNNFLLDLTYLEPYHFQNKLMEFAAAGWTVAGKAYWRSGLPFSVLNNNAENALSNGTGNGTVLADVLAPHFNHFCNSYSNPCFQTPGIFNGTGLTIDNNNNVVPAPPPNEPNQAPQTNFGNVPRNAFFGPHYADVDLSLYKNVFQKGGTHLKVGAQAFNIFNHTNFAAPNNNASLSNLGLITSDVVSPTSPYGSFGSPSSGRIMVVTGRFVF